MIVHEGELFIYRCERGKKRNIVVTLKRASDPHGLWQWLWACRGRLWGRWGRSGGCESEMRNKDRWLRLTHDPSWQGRGMGQVRYSHRLSTGRSGWLRERRKIARQKVRHRPKR